MMRRRIQRVSWFQRYKKYIYYGCGAVALGTLSFIITVVSLKNKVAEEENIVPQVENKEYVYKTDESSIRINPESLKRAQIEELDNSVVEVEGKNVATQEKEEKKEIVVNKPVKEEVNIEVSAVPVKKKLTFIKPLDGEIILEYAKDKLVYSNTLEEWITHNGVDIKGEEAMPVKVSADGKVIDKKVDPRYGNTLIVQHDDGYKTIYSNLSTLDLVDVNQEVKQGEIIAGVGAGYGFEVEEGAHIHWEVYKDGITINPIDILE